MAETEERYEKIHQNLIDAGCDQKTTDLCMVFVKEGQLSDMMPILRNHRNALLESVHKGQKQIDCLDYLLYRLKESGISPLGSAGCRRKCTFPLFFGRCLCRSFRTERTGNCS